MKLEQLIDRKTGTLYWLATFKIRGRAGMAEGATRQEAFGHAVEMMRSGGASLLDAMAAVNRTDV